MGITSLNDIYSIAFNTTFNTDQQETIALIPMFVTSQPDSQKNQTEGTTRQIG